MRRRAGVAMIELALVILPFLAITMGGVEYLYFLHIKQNLTAAAEAGLHEAVIDHNEASPILGLSPQSLNGIRPAVDSAVRNFLLDTGYSNDFVNQVTVTLDFTNRLGNKNIKFQGGQPQSSGIRLIGVVVEIPWNQALILGGLALKLYGQPTPGDDKLTVIVLGWKRWRENAPQN